MTTIVHGLENEYDGDVDVTIENAVKNKDMIVSTYGFKTHGMVFNGPDGSTLKTLDGHLMREPEIRAALVELIGEPGS